MGIKQTVLLRRRLLMTSAAGAMLVAGPCLGQSREFKIAPQPAAAGIQVFAQQAGMQILVSAGATQGQMTGLVVGDMTIGDALDRLLAGAHLSVASNDGRTIVLVPARTGVIKTGWPAAALVKTADETAGPVAAAAAASAEAEAPPVEQVVITGTHLTTGFTTPTPVTVVGAAQIEQKAAGTVIEFLHDIPQFATQQGPAAASTGAQSAAKANLSLYNLGSNRTLILIDGQRHVADGTGNVMDTNLIPGSLIDHVDIVTGGASAAYGSDAVAGVVNFVMKDRLQGFSGDVHVGVSEYGDNVEINPSIAFGTSLFDGRGHFVIGGDFTDNKGTRNFYSRPWGTLEPGIVTISNGAIPAATRIAMGLPVNIIANHVETSAYNASGLIVGGPLAGTAWMGDNNTPSIMATSGNGIINGGTTMISPGGADYGSVLNPDEDIKAAYARSAAMTRFEYEFTPTTSGYAQLMYGALHTRGDSFGARIPNFSQYPVLGTNPFLPASVAQAITATGSTVTVNGVKSPGFLYSATRDYDLSSIASRNRTETVQFNGGVKGVESLYGNDWKWDVTVGAGKATFAPDIHNTPITADFYEAAYVVAGPNGTPVCGPVATNPYFNSQPAIVKAALVSQVTPGCVPYDIFGTNKSYNQAALNWFAGASQTDFEFRQYTVQGNISGAPFTLPAGPVSLAAGMAYRRETLSSVNCPECQLGALMNQNYSLFSGQVSVAEGYVEAGIPVVRDLPFAKALDINGAVREIDYSTSGYVTTWKVGGTWDVTGDLRVRATQSHDIRAPNINELFNPGSTGNPQVTNPFNGNAQGYIKSNTVGNPSLVPEVGDTTTAGVVFTPTGTWATGLRASIDYWSIDLNKAISTLALQNVINNCYAGQTSFCQYITFDNSPLGIASVNSPNLNLNAQKTAGYDIEVDYRFPLSQWGVPGSLNTRVLGIYTLYNKSISSGLETNAVDGSGTPRFYMTAITTYSAGPYNLSLTARYNSPIKYSTNLIGPDDPAYSITLSNSINQNLWYVPVYWNGSFSYDLSHDGRKIQLYVNVDNIFDQNPPIVAWSLSGGPYDLVGRSYKVGIRFKY